MSTNKIQSLEVLDIRYPTVKLGMAGSDPRHLAPNYSCAVAILRTDTGLEGRSLVFTCGDGTQVQKAAIEALSRLVVGHTLEEFIEEPGLFAGEGPAPVAVHDKGHMGGKFGR